MLALLLSMSSLPRTLDPQLCTLVPEAPSGDSWLHEIKYDGWRLLARKHDKDVRLYTRGGVEWSQGLPALKRAIASLPVREAWLDGEIVHLDHEGLPDFEAVQRDMRARDETRLFYHVWDVPWLDTENLCGIPLLERKQRLRELITQEPSRVRYTPHVVGDG